MDNKPTQNLILTRLNSSLKLSNILRCNRISRLILGYVLSFMICTINTASAITCHWQFHVECFYQDMMGLHLAWKNIPVDSYWHAGDFYCHLHPNISAAMDKACAAANPNPSNSWPWFASSWGGQTLTEENCDDVGDGWYDSTNKLCVEGDFKQAPPHQSSVEMNKPVQKLPALKRERQKQNQLRREEPLKQNQLSEEQIRQEQLKQEQVRQEQMKQEQLKEEQLKQEQLREGQMRQEQQKQEQLREEPRR